MRRLRAAALSEVELAMDIINQAKAHLRAQGIDQWQTGYPDRDCLERDVRTGDQAVLLYRHHRGYPGCGAHACRPRCRGHLGGDCG